MVPINDLKSLDMDKPAGYVNFLKHDNILAIKCKV
jgi:hypothetical protein